MANIRIVSDGFNHGTRVFQEDGTEIKGISKIVIEPIEGGENEFLRATITFDWVGLDLNTKSAD